MYKEGIEQKYRQYVKYTKELCGEHKKMQEKWFQEKEPVTEERYIHNKEQKTGHNSSTTQKMKLKIQEDIN